MSRSLDQIKKPIDEALSAFEGHFRKAMESQVPLLDKITFYLVKRKGKQVRPMFVFLAAKVCGEISESTFRAASMIELLHTATLVHDDVVDDSLQRRSFFSINALWKNKIAVLVGDFLLSKGLLLSVENKDYDLLEILSTSVREMSEGELLQLERARFMDTNEEIYFEIIRKKTASLIASCCQIGAASTVSNPETLENMRKFGELIGLAFQIRDDLFDFGDNKSGKPAGIDIKEKKLTLPVLYAMSKAGASETRRIKQLIKSKKAESQKMTEVVAFIEQYGGMEYARNKMIELRDQAFAILEQTAPETEHKAHMKNLINFVIERNN